MLNKFFVLLLLGVQIVLSFTLPKDVLYAPVPSAFYDCRARSRLPDKDNPVVWSFDTGIIDYIIHKQPEPTIPLSDDHTNMYWWGVDAKDTNGKIRQVTMLWNLVPTSTSQFSQVIVALSSDVS